MLVVARRYFPHIYFESKAIKGKDSVYEVVPDLGRPGVRSAREVKLLAAATVADLLDGYTVDHRGRRVRYTIGKLRGRLLVLYRLARRYGGIEVVEKAHRIAFEALKLPKSMRKAFIKRELRKLGVSTEFIEQAIARTNAGRSRRSRRRR